MKRGKSWIYQHGYRVALRCDLQRLFWVCRYCHHHKTTSVKSVFNVTRQTTGVLNHLQLPRAGHGYTRQGTKAHLRQLPGQATLGYLNSQGLVVEQLVANKLSGFNV